MAKIKISELAKELACESKDLLGYFIPNSIILVFIDVNLNLTLLRHDDVKAKCLTNVFDGVAQGVVCMDKSAAERVAVLIDIFIGAVVSHTLVVDAPRNTAHARYVFNRVVAALLEYHVNERPKERFELNKMVNRLFKEVPKLVVVR